MPSRTPLAPRSAALVWVALGALALVAWLGGQWVLGDSSVGVDDGQAFAPVGGAEAVRSGLVAEGLESTPNAGAASGAAERPRAADARREDP
ncbi:MAG: hypothetical protein ACYS26_10560, partial [Planctomycetota bacterium]